MIWNSRSGGPDAYVRCFEILRFAQNNEVGGALEKVRSSSIVETGTSIYLEIQSNDTHNAFREVN